MDAVGLDGAAWWTRIPAQLPRIPRWGGRKGHIRLWHRSLVGSRSVDVNADRTTSAIGDLSSEVHCDRILRLLVISTSGTE